MIPSPTPIPSSLLSHLLLFDKMLKLTLPITLLLLQAFFLAIFAVASVDLSNQFDVKYGGERVKIYGGNLYLSLDATSGSGFVSKQEYLYGKIDMQIKLVPGNSAGTVTTYYVGMQLSSPTPNQDEIDFEFLGNVSGQPYVLHTNLFTRGKGEREQQFYLWFDPRDDFHTYSVLWNPHLILLAVDGVPIRVYKNNEARGIPFPKDQPMRLYSTIWDADSWATRGGRDKIDWSQAPFTASYRNFNPDACVWIGGRSSCPTSSGAWMHQELDACQIQKFKWIQQNFMIYNYCTDYRRFPHGFPPECSIPF